MGSGAVVGRLKWQSGGIVYTMVWVWFRFLIRSGQNDHICLESRLGQFGCFGQRTLVVQGSIPVSRKITSDLNKLKTSTRQLKLRIWGKKNWITTCRTTQRPRNRRSMGWVNYWKYIGCPVASCRLVANKFFIVVKAQSLWKKLNWRFQPL